MLYSPLTRNFDNGSFGMSWELVESIMGPEDNSAQSVSCSLSHEVWKTRICTLPTPLSVTLLRAFGLYSVVFGIPYKVIGGCWRTGVDASMYRLPRGSNYPNLEVLGPTFYTYSGFGDLTASCLRAWTLRWRA